MRFIQRLGYYLGGFAIGLVILAYFLSGKNASCDYGPNARTVKNISSKPIQYSFEVEQFVEENGLDSVTVINLIRYGKVDFSKSNTKIDSCKLYHIDNIYRNQSIFIKVRNCDSLAILRRIGFISP